MAEAVLKSGYLVKLDVVSQRSWKKRFFVLTDTTLHYYENEQNMAKPKGSVLIVHDSTVKNTGTEGGKSNCFNLCTPFTELHVSADDEDEVASWIAALEGAIKQTKDLPRGYLTKRGGIFDGGNRKKYFIMHVNAITWHADHEHVKVIQGTMPLLDSTDVEYADASFLITLKYNRETLQLQFENNDNETWTLWKSALQSVFGSRGAKRSGADPAVGGSSAEHTDADGSSSSAAVVVSKTGELLIRPPKGGDVWPAFTVQLTNKSFEVLEADPVHVDQMTVVYSFTLTLSCAAFETNLGTHAFEIVTPTKVLHMRAESKDAVTEWIRAIREVILRSRPDPADPLFHQAMLKINDDVIYEVIFPESKPLGIVLERAGEWGVVKISNVNETHVHVGSVLTAVNAQSVILYNYVDTIALLRGWKPPLKLIFRKAPEKEGFLMKQSTGKGGNSDIVGRNWKKRYVVLKEGRLIYRENSDPNSALKGDLPLMGSAVSLVSSHEVGKFYCFRLVSGVTSLVMQADSVEEMMDWASTLYHASFIANGGNHIVGLQRARAAHERRKQREAEEKAAAEVARLAALEEAERVQRELEEQEKQRREQLAAAEVAKLQAEDSEKKGGIDAANATLATAIAALKESSPPTVEALEDAKEAIAACKSTEGADSVMILQGELLVSEIESEFGEQLRLVAQITEALESNTVGLLSNVLVEVSMLPGFEEENSELMAEVQGALAAAKQRDTVVVMLAEAVEAGNVAALGDLIAQATALGLTGATVSELSRAEELVKEHESSSAAAAAASPSEESAREGTAIAAAVAAAASEGDEDASGAVDSLASMSFANKNDPGSRAKDSDDEADSDDEDGDSDEEEEEGGDVVGELRSSAGGASASSDASASALASMPAAPAVDDGKKKRAASVYVNAGADSAAASRFAQFEAAASKEIVLPPRAAATLDDMPARKPTSPKKASRRGSAVTYQELIVENKRANAMKSKAAEEARGPAREYAPEELATSDDIRRMFHSYAKSLSDLAGAGSNNEFLNPMQFSAIFRLVTGQQGNLYMEMQMFNKFDASNNAALSEEDFVNGWIKLSQDENHQDYLYKIKNMVGEDNLML